MLLTRESITDADTKVPFLQTTQMIVTCLVVRDETHQWQRTKKGENEETHPPTLFCKHLSCFWDVFDENVATSQKCNVINNML